MLGPGSKRRIDRSTLCRLARQEISRLNQPVPDALAQFLGGGLGEGDDENFVDWHLQIDHCPQHQHGNGIGLAGTGARLNESDAL